MEQNSSDMVKNVNFLFGYNMRHTKSVSGARYTCHLADLFVDTVFVCSCEVRCCLVRLDAMLKPSLCRYYLIAQCRGIARSSASTPRLANAVLFSATSRLNGDQQKQSSKADGARRVPPSLLGLGFLAGVLSAAAPDAAGMKASKPSTTRCEAAPALPSYGSSSDGIPGSEYSSARDTVPLSEIYLRPIRPSACSTGSKSDPEDSRSLRAWEVSFRTVQKEQQRMRSLNDTGAEKGDGSTYMATASLAPKHTITQDERFSSLSKRQGTSSIPVTTKKNYFYHSPEVADAKLDKFVLLAAPDSVSLGADVAHLLGVPLCAVDVGSFSDGETRVQVEESVQGKQVYIVCSTTSADATMQLLLLISTVRRASARKITAIIPYFGYSRQDRRKGQNREPIAAADLGESFL
jgi:N-terminal domain of ribose phosphate pyrophosphokinase